MTPNLKEFMEAMSAKWPVALTILFGSGSLIVADQSAVKYVQSLPDWFLSIAFVAALFSSSILLVALIEALISLVIAPFQKRRLAAWRAKQVEKLNELPPEELYVLLWAARAGRQIFLAQLNEPRLEPLIAKGFVVAVRGSHSILDWPYKIPEHIWNAVRKEIVGQPPGGTLESPFSRWGD